MTMQYKLHSEKIQDNELGTYQSYGICYGKTVLVRDISINPEPLESYIHLLNAFKANVQYIYELIDYFFALFY